MDQKYKYRFEIHFASPELQEVEYFLQKSGVTNRMLAKKETYYMVCIKDNCVAHLKDLLKEAYEELGYKIYQIEGGKIE